MSIIFILAKYLAFLALSGVSMLLSYNMFSQLSAIPVESLLLSIVAIAIESLKIFSLVRGNTLYALNLKAQALRAWSMYAILAVLAVLASYGFTLTVVDRGIRASEQSFVQVEMDANREELSIVEEQIANLDRQIEVAVERQQNTPFDFITAWRNITEQINQLENQRARFIQRRLELSREYADLRTAFAREQAETRTTTNMFNLMASSFGMTESFLMLALLLTIAILIELGIVSTSPSIPIDRKHITHILSEFAHNLHLDELEAERALDKAKRQKQIHKMYEDAGLRDPNEWPAIDRRRHDPDDLDDPGLEAAPPNENLRKLMADPLDPTLPDDSAIAAFTPEEEDVSFFDALKNVLRRKPDDVAAHAPPEEEVHEEPHPKEDEEPHVDTIKPRGTTRIEVEEPPVVPIRQLHPVAPKPVVEDKPLPLTPKEMSQAFDTAMEVVPKEEPKPEIPTRVVKHEEPLVQEPEPAPEPEPEPEVTPEPEPEVPTAPEPEPEPEEEAPKPVRKRRRAPNPERVTVTDTPPVEAKPEPQPEPEPEPEPQPAETPQATPVQQDSVNELRVRSPQPQEVGETKTYRFGKTTPEVRKLFIRFVDGLFKENAEEFLQDPAVAAREAKIKPALGTIFIKRLCELKGSTGLALITQKEDGLYYPNYTKEYIISYATKEVSSQGGSA